MRVLVCGGRNFHDREYVFNALDRLLADTGVDVIIEGGASGADLLAVTWASFHSIPVETHEPNWEKFGKRAGPIRNSKMLKEGKPDLVLAFAGGAGTKSMVTQAQRAGVPVVLA